MTILCLIFPETTTLCFPQHLLHFTIPPTVHNSSFSAFSPTLVALGVVIHLFILNFILIIWLQCPGSLVAVHKLRCSLNDLLPFHTVHGGSPILQLPLWLSDVKSQLIVKRACC